MGKTLSTADAKDLAELPEAISDLQERVRCVPQTASLIPSCPCKLSTVLVAGTTSFECSAFVWVCSRPHPLLLPMYLTHSASGNNACWMV